jgi:hypothetical protein
MLFLKKKQEERGYVGKWKILKKLDASHVFFSAYIPLFCHSLNILQEMKRQPEM